MTPGQERVVGVLELVKKLPKERQDYWLAQLRKISAGQAKVGTLVYEDTGKPVEAPTWSQNLASLLDRVRSAPDEASLAVANEFDRVYQAIAEEARKMVDALPKVGFALWPLAVVAVALAWSWSKRGTVAHG